MQAQSRGVHKNSGDVWCEEKIPLAAVFSWTPSRSPWGRSAEGLISRAKLARKIRLHERYGTSRGRR